MTIQSILINRKYANSLPEALSILKKYYGVYNKVDITTNYYRFRQQNPNLFKKNSFRTIIINDAVKFIVGKYKI